MLYIEKGGGEQDTAHLTNQTQQLIEERERSLSKAKEEEEEENPNKESKREREQKPKLANKGNPKLIFNL